MFGLIFFAGLAFMAVCFATAATLIFIICRALRVRTLFAAALSFAVPLSALLGANAADIQSTREFNALCQAKASRRVVKVLEDVEGIRVRGDAQSLFVWGTGHKYGYVEWEAPPLKWRSNQRSNDICGPSRACNVETFSARYELHILADRAGRHIDRLELRVIDPLTATVLASDEGFALNLLPQSDVQGLFFAPWRLPREMLVTPVRGCAISDPNGFVHGVLVPRPKNAG